MSYLPPAGLLGQGKHTSTLPEGSKLQQFHSMVNAGVAAAASAPPPPPAASGDSLASELEATALQGPRKKKKSSADRRAQARRAVNRLAGLADSTTPLPTPPAATSLPSRQLSSAPLPDTPGAPSSVCPPALAPAAPRDLLVLTSTYASPWRSLRKRKRRVPHPHRHERVCRAQTAAQHDAHALHHMEVVFDAYHELREACWTILGPLYNSIVPGLSLATPGEPSLSTLPGRHTVHCREDVDQAWCEVLDLATLGAQSLLPGNWSAGEETVDAFHRQSAWWCEELLAAHTVLVRGPGTFNDHELDDLILPYVVGLVAWFLEWG